MGKKEYLIKMKDFVRHRKEDGSVVLVHPFLSGEIAWDENTEPVPVFFHRIREFSEKNQTLLSPELARACEFMCRSVEEIEREIEGDDFFEEDEFLD